jgi:hypothetical protein
MARLVFLISFDLIANGVRGLKVLWRIDPLLGNDRETNNQTTAVAMQRPALNSGSLLEAVFSMWSGPRLYHAINKIAHVEHLNSGINQYSVVFASNFG